MNNELFSRLKDLAQKENRARLAVLLGAAAMLLILLSELFTPSEKTAAASAAPADDNVYRLDCSESLIDAGKFRTEDFNQLVVDHQTVHNVALADEVGNECVFRLVVDLFRGTHLLDITLVHDNDRVGHRERLFLLSILINLSKYIN